MKIISAPTIFRILLGYWSTLLFP